MRTYKFLTFGGALVIIVLEALLFSRASTDAPDIGIPAGMATSQPSFVPAARAAGDAALNRIPTD